MARPALLPAAVPGGAGDVKYRLDDGQIEVVDDRVAEALRAKTPAERVSMALDCNETARLVIAGYLRSRHPDWRDGQVRAEVARRMSGEAS